VSRGLPLACAVLWAAPVLATFAGSAAPWGDLGRPFGLALLVGGLGSWLAGRILGHPLAGALVVTGGALLFWELGPLLQLVRPLPGGVLFAALVAAAVAALVGLPRLASALRDRPGAARGLEGALLVSAAVLVVPFLPGLPRGAAAPIGAEPWAPVVPAREGAPDVLVVLCQGLRPGDLDGLAGAGVDGPEGWPSSVQGLWAMARRGRLAAWFGVAGYRTRMVRGGPVDLRGEGFEELVEGGLELLEHRLVARSALGLLRLDLQVSAYRGQLESALRGLPTPVLPGDSRPTFTVAALRAPGPPYVMPADGGVPEDSLLTVWDLGETPVGDSRDARARQRDWLVRELRALASRLASTGRPTRLVVAGDQPGLRIRLGTPES
jgi:hypothetical protein